MIIKILTSVSVLLLSLTVMADGEFPEQPVTMYPGYGSEGAGNHSAIPFGREGEDCIVNPFSWSRGSREGTVTKMVPGDIISIPINVLFDFDGDVVRPVGKRNLVEAHRSLIEGGVTKLKVVGHTDSKGTDEYNQRLGLQRARAVMLELAALGIEVSVIASEGESSPIAVNTNRDGSDNPQGRQKNRRVDIEVLATQVAVEEDAIIEFDRNPQIFHVLSQKGSVNCGVGAQQRIPQLLWQQDRRGNGAQRRFGQGWF